MGVNINMGNNTRLNTLTFNGLIETNAGRNQSNYVNFSIHWKVIIFTQDIFLTELSNIFPAENVKWTLQMSNIPRLVTNLNSQPLNSDLSAFSLAGVLNNNKPICRVQSQSVRCFAIHTKKLLLLCVAAPVNCQLFAILLY